MSAPLLELRATTVTYPSPGGPVVALREVDLTVRAGDVVGVAGEPGAGKSTLGLLVANALPRHAIVTGRVVRAARVTLWAGERITCGGTTYALRPTRRVCDQIAEPMLRHGIARSGSVDSRIRHLVQRAGIPARQAHGAAADLDAGQRHRVLAAMVLACDPRLVIADEPGAAWSPVAELLAIPDGALLLIGRDPGACRRLVVLRAGRIVSPPVT